jgi:hypothetical protein
VAREQAEFADFEKMCEIDPKFKHKCKELHKLAVARFDILEARIACQLSSAMLGLLLGTTCTASWVVSGNNSLTKP